MGVESQQQWNWNHTNEVQQYLFLNQVLGWCLFSLTNGSLITHSVMTNIPELYGHRETRYKALNTEKICAENIFLVNEKCRSNLTLFINN